MSMAFTLKCNHDTAIQMHFSLSLFLPLIQPLKCPIVTLYMYVYTSMEAHYKDISLFGEEKEKVHCNKSRVEHMNE